VSRTVVREAVKVLVATGLVYTRRGSGLYVANKAPSLPTTMLDSLTPADPTQVISLYEFRLMLEPTAARLAAERITPHELRELRELVALNQRSAETQQRQHDSYDNPYAGMGVRHRGGTHTGIAAELFRATRCDTRGYPGRGIRRRRSSDANPPGMGTGPLQTRDAATTWC
jgi:FCD domain/Bacterial regulatory proteins, gntR family